ncbi:MAG: HD domain-containing protein [Chloroflexi bacterium]|nr:HD domain-containing protein [Chloroflexota bacterium]
MNDTKVALIQAMESYFNGDTKRIDHAHKVTDYAEKLLEGEGGNYSIVMGAAVLHDIGIHEAERKHGSNSGKFQEIEGPPIAREILAKLEFEAGQVNEICEIIAHHHSPGKITTRNFGMLYDADWLVNLSDEYNIKDQQKLENIIDRVFLTQTGKALARTIYLKDKSQEILR